VLGLKWLGDLRGEVSRRSQESSHEIAIGTGSVRIEVPRNFMQPNWSDAFAWVKKSAAASFSGEGLLFH